MMKKLIVLILAFAPFVMFAQTDLSKWHDANTLLIKLDENLDLKANSASPTFTGTVTIPSPFTLGATSVTTTGAKLNYLTAATGTTGTNTTNVVFSTSPSITTPTFVTSVTMGSAELNEAELEILDGATLTTAQLNYLNTATGTTGTNTTNLVYSTSPTLITPALGTPSALVGTNISGTGASFTAGAVTGFTPASGTLTLAGADAVTITTTATTNVTLPTTGTLVASSVTDLLAPKASPTFTGTAALPIITVAGDASFSSTAHLGVFGDATQIVLSEASVNTNPLLGVFPMVNFTASANKVFAGTHNRLLLITANQTNDASMVGAEDQLRIKDVNLATGNHAGLWAYAEQSGTTVLSGGGTFDAILGTVESAASFSAGATEQITGLTLDCSLNAGATIDGSANFSGIYIKSNGLDWFNGIKITGATNDILLQNGATIENAVDGIMTLTEPVVAVAGKLTVTGGVSSTATVTEHTVLVTIDSTKLVGSAVGDLAHVDGAVLVAAPASGFLLEFVSAVFIYDYLTTAFGGGANDVVVQVGASGTQVTVSSAITSASLLTAAEDKILRLGSIATELSPAAGGAISLNGTLLTNPGTAAGALRVHLTYRIHTTGL